MNAIKLPTFLLTTRAGAGKDAREAGRGSDVAQLSLHNLETQRKLWDTMPAASTLKT